MGFPRAMSRLLAPPLVAAMFAVHVEGCASMQSQRRSISEPYDVSGTQGLIRVGPGSEIEFTRRDGTVLRGIFRGSERMDEEEYARHWAEVVAKRGGADSLPVRGSQIEIRPHRGPLRSVRFEGFDYRGIEVRDSTEVAKVVAFARLAEIREPGGRAWNPRTLDADAVSGRLPSFAVIRLGVASDEVRVPVDHVATVEFAGTSGSDAAMIGIIVGVTLVVLVVVAAASSKPSGPDCDADPNYNPLGG